MPRAPGSHVSPAALAFAQAPRAEHEPTRPPTAAASVAPVEVSKVRAILEDDRRDAGEQRPDAAPIQPLQTASYTIPLGVQIRRLGRGRLRAALALSAALMAAAAGLGALALRGLRGDAARATDEGATAEPGQRAELAAAPREVARPSLRSESARAAAVLEIVPEDLSAPEQADLPPTQAADTDSPVRSGELHHRFVRADALLRHPSERAAREARTLLESALPHAPRDAHGYAALATACHRLGDAQCAEQAIGHALELRPKRSRYVALGRLIRDDLTARR